MLMRTRYHDVPPCPLLAISCTTSKDRSLRNGPAAKPGDLPGRNEGGLRLDRFENLGKMRAASCSCFRLSFRDKFFFFFFFVENKIANFRNASFF